MMTSSARSSGSEPGILRSRKPPKTGALITARWTKLDCSFRFSHSISQRKYRAPPKCQRHRRRVREAPETRANIGSGREPGEGDVEAYRCSVHEMTGLLSLAGKATRI